MITHRQTVYKRYRLKKDTVENPIVSGFGFDTTITFYEKNKIPKNEKNCNFNGNNSVCICHYLREQSLWLTIYGGP